MDRIHYRCREWRQRQTSRRLETTKRDSRMMTRKGFWHQREDQSCFEVWQIQFIGSMIWSTQVPRIKRSGLQYAPICWEIENSEQTFCENKETF
jgi:hypothetical protein